MRNGWQTRKLKDLLEIQNGYAFDSGRFSPSGKMPLIRIRDLKDGTETETRFTGDYDEKYVVEAGDFLIGMDGEFGCYEWKGDLALLNQRVCRLQNFESALSPRFLFYGVNSHLKAIEEVTGYTTVKHLSSRQILDIEFLVPPISEQQRIVGALDEAFAGLATAKANARKNLQNARALFESHLQSVFSRRGREWNANQIDALTEPESPITYGVVKPGPEGEIRFVRGGDLVRGAVQLDELRTITRAVSDQYRRTLLRGGELLICLVGQPGQVAVAPKELAGANIARQVGLIRLKRNVDAEFVRFFLQSAPGVEALGARESGSVQQVINLGELRHLIVPYPKIEEQRKIVANLFAMETKTQRLESLYQQKLAALEALKKSLLHQAFTGAL